MNQFNIQIPEGHQIDLENSSLQSGIIKFKPIKKQLPKTWKEIRYNQYISPTEEIVKASIAVDKLSVLRNIYRNGWIPDWEKESLKYCILKFKNTLIKVNYFYIEHFLTFQSAEIRDEFLENFKDLIEEASPILFG